MTLLNPAVTPEVAAQNQVADPNPEAGIARCFYTTDDGLSYGMDLSTDQITESNPLPSNVDTTKAFPTIKISNNRNMAGVHPRYVTVAAEGTGTIGEKTRTFSISRRWYFCTKAAFDAIKTGGTDADTVTLGGIVFKAMSKTGERII